MAQGLEGLTRTQRKLRAPGDEAAALLRRLAIPMKGQAITGARVRRLALEALITAALVDPETLGAAAHDPDAQVRRAAMRAAANAAPQSAAADLHSILNAGRADDSPIVRLEALRSLRARADEASCAAALAGTGDRDMQVTLFAIDQLGACAAAPRPSRRWSERSAICRAPATRAAGIGRRTRWWRSPPPRPSAAPRRCRNSPARGSGSCGCTPRARRRS